MAWFLPALGAIGSFVSANAGTIGTAASVAGTAASVGTSIASAVKSPPKVPVSLDQTMAERARIAAARKGAGTLLTGPQGDLSVAPIGKRTLLGG